MNRVMEDVSNVALIDMAKKIGVIVKQDAPDGSSLQSQGYTMKQTCQVGMWSYIREVFLMLISEISRYRSMLFTRAMEILKRRNDYERYQQRNTCTDKC